VEGLRLTGAGPPGARVWFAAMRLPLRILAVLITAAAAAAPASAAPRDVLYVGNNWDGTADVVDPHSFQKLARIDIVPDKAQRLAEIQSSPDRYGYFLAIRNEVGEGHDQFVDDMFSSHDGRFLYVSRPSLADVVAFDLRTAKIVWRFPVEGYRADHMAISPDGRRLLVSASTARKVHVIDTATGRSAGEFASGDQPHENNYSRDGKLIYHASIGTVYTPFDEPAMDGTKGERVFEVVDARTLKVLKRLDMGQKLAEAGYPDMSSAVRPMALSPDERKVYFQVSFFHGFVEYDLVHDKVLRLARLPLSDEAAKKRREDYLLDSAHHGLAMNPEGTKLCAAGTMSDYAAIVRRDTFAYRLAAFGQKPYWATNSGDGRYCFVSFSGDDRVSVISYASEREVGSVHVGDHPQRMRMGTLADGALGVRPGAGASPGRPGGPRPRLRVTVRPRRVRAGRPVRLRVRVTALRAGRRVAVRGARVRVAGVSARTGRRGRAILRKRRGLERVRRYRVRASRRGYRTGFARVRATRG
jgi:DNA-binding beta-propeller fold protein YncE